jgi:hypothetical protein
MSILCFCSVPRQRTHALPLDGEGLVGVMRQSSRRSPKGAGCALHSLRAQCLERRASPPSPTFPHREEGLEGGITLDSVNSEYGIDSCVATGAVSRHAGQGRRKAYPSTRKAAGLTRSIGNERADQTQYTGNRVLRG